MVFLGGGTTYPRELGSKGRKNDVMSKTIRSVTTNHKQQKQSQKLHCRFVSTDMLILDIKLTAQIMVHCRV
jgi:hypothetical protein